MDKKTTISLRALFLLIVFFLNTSIGFACAVGTGLWSDHRHDMQDMHAMHHDEKQPVSHCCGDGMVKFELLDKSKAQQDQMAYFPVQALLYPVLQLTGLSEWHRSNPHQSIALKQNPPPVDIRVSIQSFQI
jgi:hypothetical protein